MHTGVATTPKKEWEVCHQPQRLSRGPYWWVPNLLSGNPRKVWLACPPVSPNVETWWYRAVVWPSPQSSLWLDLGSYRLQPLWIWNAMLLHSLALSNNLTNKIVFCVVPKKQDLVPNVLNPAPLWWIVSHRPNTNTQRRLEGLPIQKKVDRGWLLHPSHQPGTVFNTSLICHFWKTPPSRVASSYTLKWKYKSLPPLRRPAHPRLVTCYPSFFKSRVPRGLSFKKSVKAWGRLRVLTNITTPVLRHHRGLVVCRHHDGVRYIVVGATHDFDKAKVLIHVPGYALGETGQLLLDVLFEGGTAAPVHLLDFCVQVPGQHQCIRTTTTKRVRVYAINQHALWHRVVEGPRCRFDVDPDVFIQHILTEVGLERRREEGGGVRLWLLMCVCVYSQFRLFKATHGVLPIDCAIIHKLPSLPLTVKPIVFTSYHSLRSPPPHCLHSLLNYRIHFHKTSPVR